MKSKCRFIAPPSPTRCREGASRPNAHGQRRSAEGKGSPQSSAGRWTARVEGASCLGALAAAGQPAAMRHGGGAWEHPEAASRRASRSDAEKRRPIQNVLLIIRRQRRSLLVDTNIPNNTTNTVVGIFGRPSYECSRLFSPPALSPAVRPLVLSSCRLLSRSKGVAVCVLWAQPFLFF